LWIIIINFYKLTPKVGINLFFTSVKKYLTPVLRYENH
jgi:hypothetical protein